VTGETVEDDDRERVASEARDRANLENRIVSLEGKVSDLWLIFGPIVAIGKSWKVMAALGAFLVYLNKPGIAAAIQKLLGDGQ
jgi:hypothetical protein